MEKTRFIKLLGNSPTIKILDILITGRELNYSISDLSKQANIGRSTFYRMMDDLLKNQIIIPTKKYGNIQLFKINQNNKIVKELILLYDKIHKITSDKEIEKQKITLKN